MTLAETEHLYLEDDGSLWIMVPLDPSDPECDEHDFERIGWIEDEDCVPLEYEREYAWLVDQWRDAVRFRVGCESAATVAYSMAQARGR